MEKKRSIEDIRKSISGRIYIYFANEQIGKRFLIDAEAEGYKCTKDRYDQFQHDRPAFAAIRSKGA